MKDNVWIPTSVKVDSNKTKRRSYKILTHPLIGSSIQYRETMFTITAVFKEWNLGWYISIELETPEIQDRYIRIPYENISSRNPLIIENIDILRNCIKEVKK